MLHFDHTQIKGYREFLNMSQTRAAELAGVNQQQWSRWESGESSPTVDNLCKIMDALMMGYDTIAFLFTDTDA